MFCSILYSPSQESPRSVETPKRTSQCLRTKSSPTESGLRTREASRPADPTLEGPRLPSTNSTPLNPTPQKKREGDSHPPEGGDSPHQTPHHRNGRGIPTHQQEREGGRVIPTHQTLPPPHHNIKGKEGGGFPAARPHTTEKDRREGDSHHQTPHHREGRRGGFPINPTTNQQGGYFLYR